MQLPSLNRRVVFGIALAIVVSPAAPAAHARAATPRPAVARIVVEEPGGAAFGSGVLVDTRAEFGLVVTNWHVVRDASGPIRVVFSDGFQSEARALKLDEDWDLAALVIWRPPASPIPLATSAPRPGDRLTICGYGEGEYREATGRCTNYFAPDENLPREIVELDVEARQGDSGGPILNARGELAGVLFGAGQGATLGSFGGRVAEFLASLGSPRDGEAAQVAQPSGPLSGPPAATLAETPGPLPREFEPQQPSPSPWPAQAAAPPAPGFDSISEPPSPSREAPSGDESLPVDTLAVDGFGLVESPLRDASLGGGPPWYEGAKTALAVVGLLFVGARFVRLVS